MRERLSVGCVSSVAAPLHAWHTVVSLLGAQQLHVSVALAWAESHPHPHAEGHQPTLDTALRELLHTHAEMHDVGATPWWDGYWLGGCDPLEMLYALVGDPDATHAVLHTGAYLQGSGPLRMDEE
jgi:hypothetical protein